MNWLLYSLLMADPTNVIQQPNNQDQATKQASEAELAQPDMELLLFLAEWDGVEKDQWVDPEIFAEDSQFNQQLDNNKAQSDEKDPDNH